MKPVESPDGAGSGREIDMGTRITVHPDASIREVIKARSQSGLPVLVAEGSKVLGVIDDDAIYQAITRFGVSKAVSK
jgi:CBS domain-containing protein